MRTARTAAVRAFLRRSLAALRARVLCRVASHRRYGLAGHRHPAVGMKHLTARLGRRNGARERDARQDEFLHDVMRPLTNLFRPSRRAQARPSLDPATAAANNLR
jgi:hypothetical protein